MVEASTTIVIPLRWCGAIFIFIFFSSSKEVSFDKALSQEMHFIKTCRNAEEIHSCIKLFEESVCRNTSNT